MQTFSFQIPDEGDREFVLSLLNKLGIRLIEQENQPQAKTIKGTFYQNAKRHIAKSGNGASPSLSSDIDMILYGK
jgi:hypothetical protein